MRYLAAYVYACLKVQGCSFEGDAYLTGQLWLSPGCQVFFLPEPDEIDDVHWFDADVLDHNLADRWVGFRIDRLIKRYP